MEILKNSIKLTGDEIQDLSYDCKDKKIIDQSRWETFHQGVLEIDGKNYLIDWSTGSTEMQDTENEDGEFPEVIEVEEKTKKWILKEKQDKLNNLQFAIEKKAIEFKQYTEEKQELIKTSKNMIEYYQEKIKEYEYELQKREESLKLDLLKMIPADGFKETKTQESYKTPSMQLIKKKPEKKISLKKEIDIDKAEIDEKYIKVKKSIDWANFKKELIIKDDKVINKETGEIINICELETSSEEIKFKLV